jgi:hypothetical protein
MVRSGDLSVTAPLSKPSFAKTALNPLFGIVLRLKAVNVIAGRDALRLGSRQPGHAKRDAPKKNARIHGRLAASGIHCF